MSPGRRVIGALLWCVAALVPVACTAPGAIQNTGKQSGQEAGKETGKETVQETVRIPIPEDMQQLVVDARDFGQLVERVDGLGEQARAQDLPDDARHQRSCPE